MTWVKALLWSVLVVSFLTNMVPTTTGEQEPNDSLDITNVLGEEWVSGHVDYDHENETYIDVDFYRVDLPANRISVLTLKNKEVKRFETIYLETYNEYKELTGLFVDSHGNYDDNIYTQEPGAEVRGMVIGRSLDSHFFVKISGKGNYSVKSHLLSLPDINDDPFNSPEIDINVGKIAGMVYTIRYESITIEDQDQYEFKCNSSNFRFKIERTDQGSEPMNIWLQRNGRTDEMPDAILGPEKRVYSKVSLLDNDENKRLYNGSDYLTHGPSTAYYLTLSGDGSYEITIEWFPLIEEKEIEEPDDDDDDDDNDDDDDEEQEVETFYLTGCMLSSILVPLLLLIVIVQALALIFRKGKEKEKAEALAKSTSTIDDPLKAAPQPEQKGKVKEQTSPPSKP